MAPYVPRAVADTVLHGVVQEHLETFLAAAAARTDGVGLPRFIEREFRGFLRCGVLAHGFLRVRCDDCAFERLVPLSCKGRTVCASCGGRRMAEQAANLVGAVLPWVRSGNGSSRCSYAPCSAGTAVGHGAPGGPTATPAQ